MFNWQSFYGNGEELTKVQLPVTGGHTHATCSLTPSDFVIFVEWELSQHFSHPVVATIQLLLVVWATHFIYCTLMDYSPTYNGVQIENMDKTYKERTDN